MSWKYVLAVVVGVCASMAIRGHYGWPRFPHGLLTGLGIFTVLLFILEPKLMTSPLSTLKELLGVKPESETEDEDDLPPLPPRK
ncbi:MAG: hypothetical protein QF406_14915 [Verrucomicrobiota bacterium]|jgi:hypothetical protein|nr:hypothetical protein [Verrucomicrobiota bacterium]